MRAWCSAFVVVNAAPRAIEGLGDVHGDQRLVLDNEDRPPRERGAHTMSFAIRRCCRVAARASGPAGSGGKLSAGLWGSLARITLARAPLQRNVRTDQRGAAKSESTCGAAVNACPQGQQPGIPRGVAGARLLGPSRGGSGPRCLRGSHGSMLEQQTRNVPTGSR